MTLKLLVAAGAVICLLSFLLWKANIELGSQQQINRDVIARNHGLVKTVDLLKKDIAKEQQLILERDAQIRDLYVSQNEAANNLERVIDNDEQATQWADQAVPVAVVGSLHDATRRLRESSDTRRQDSQTQPP